MDPAHVPLQWLVLPWTIAAVAGLNVCLRKVDPDKIFALITRHGVTHMCGAPIVYNTLIHAPQAPKGEKARKVEGLVAGASPPVAVIAGAASIGINITHVYGLTEVYGPASICSPQPDWVSLPLEERAVLSAVRACPITCRRLSPCLIRDDAGSAP